MPIRHDTGLCRICCRRRNLNKNDAIVRHNHMMRRCLGSQLTPAPGTVRLIDRPERRPPPDVYELERRVDAMEEAIRAGIPKTSEDMDRAKNTVKLLKERIYMLG